ncbi:MAG: cellulase family glycosylhydrolase [Nannocystaceae bacterium]|nr:cellulase family glycosylhydrolase [Nannocystaceae bacterium]
MGRRRLGLGLALALVACVPRCRGCETEATVEGSSDGGHGDVVLADASWTVEVDDGGRIRVRFNHADLLLSRFRFGGANGSSFEPELREVETTADRVAFTLEVPSLQYRVRVQAFAEPHGARVEFDTHAGAALAGVSGGGIQLDLRPDPRVLGTSAGKPTLDAEQRGFRWDTGRGVVSVQLDRPPPHFAYDEGANAVQFGFYAGSLPAGDQHFTMHIALPDDGSWRPASSARYAPVDPARWHRDSLPYDDVPVDLSFLNDDDKPAGAGGPIALDAIEGGFVRARVRKRFWGTNVAAYALFVADDAEIDAQARRLAAFGFNLVRIHHHDSAWVEPNVFGRRAASTSTLDDAALERLDRWVWALQSQGIYVWLDLHVGRVFTPADGIDAFAELEGGKPQGFNYVNPSIQGAMRRFAQQYLDRTNRYSGRRYLEDPGVLAVLVTNENDVSHHFGHLMTDAQRRPQHHAWFEGAVEAFAARTRLDIPRPVEPWRGGPTKLALADLEATFFGDAITQLRQLGWRGPIATTSLWGDESLYSLPSLTTGDVIDVHSYGAPETLSTNAHVESHFVHHMAMGAVAGFPVTVTEWNVPAPARDRFVGPPLVAATAALQDWDAMMLYAYVQSPIEPPVNPDIWCSWYDAGVMAMMPAAALVFRRGDVRSAEQRYVLALDREAAWGRPVHAGNAATIRTLAERSQLRLVLPDTPELPWLRTGTAPEGAIVLDDVDRDHLLAPATSVVSDTGEVTRDWVAGTHVIDTPRSQIASGWIGGRSVELSSVTITMTTAKAAVAISSLDGEPIAKSKRLLLSAVAQVAPSPGVKLPLLSEPIAGTVLLRSDQPRLRVRALGRGGASRAPVESQASAGVHTLVLPPEAPVHFWSIEAP